MTLTRGGSRTSHWGGTNPHWRGHQPLTQALFGENICKNKRIWSCWGGTRWKLLYVDPPLLTMLREQNGVPPLSHTYILYDYIYDGTNKTKPKEIA